MAADTMTQVELEAKLAALGLLEPEQTASIICSLIGHSKIQTQFFGYFYCGRCGAQVGDRLLGGYDASKVVVVGHNCPTCQENYEQCTWQDKYQAPDPFKSEEPQPE